MTGEKEGGWHRLVLGDERARGQVGGNRASAGGKMDVYLGSGALLAGLGAAGWDSRGGVGEAAAGSPSRYRCFLLSFFVKEISNISFLLATCRPPSQKTFSISL